MLLVDKPAGITSHDVVSHVRRATGERAVGHTGTLDPFATGLLVVLVGRATRLARFTEGLDKWYRATLRLGERTDTDDATGEVVERLVPDAWPDPVRVREVLAGFVGRQQQRPPAYSAKRVQGERSYRLARRGAPVELPPVEVMVHAVECLGWTPPQLEFRAVVGTGTYVRALGRDIAQALGTVGHLEALRRERIGPFDVAEAVPLDALRDAVVVAPAGRLVAHFPRLALDAAGLEAVRHGRRVPSPPGLTGTVALWCGEDVVAMGEVREGDIQPVVVLGAA